MRLEPGDPVAIDEDVLVATHARDRAAHRQVGRVIDIELIDLADRRRAHTDRDRTGADERGKTLALGGRQRLGIANARDPVTARTHDHRGRDDRAAGRRHADLVHSDDPDEPVVPEAALMAEGRDDRSHRPVAYRNSNDPAGWRGRVMSARGLRPGDQPFVRRSRRVAALPTRSRRK